MSTLLLQLAGPIQCWDSRRSGWSQGAQKRLDPAASLPTHTGIVGLLGSALGRPRGADFSDLLALDIWVRIDQPGQPLREFRTSRRRDGHGQVVCMPLIEQTVHDAVFLAGVTGDDDLLTSCAQALLDPAWAPYLGTRASVPSRPILLGLVDADIADAVGDHPWIAADWWRKCAAGPGAIVRVRPYRRGDPGVQEWLTPPAPEPDFDFLGTAEAAARAKPTP